MFEFYFTKGICYAVLLFSVLLIIGIGEFAFQIRYWITDSDPPRDLFWPKYWKILKDDKDNYTFIVWILVISIISSIFAWPITIPILVLVLLLCLTKFAYKELIKKD